MSDEASFAAAPAPPPSPGAAEVAAAPGRALHEQDDEGWEVALSAGAQAAGAIAWVARRSREREGGEEVAYTLHAARGGATRTWRLESALAEAAALHAAARAAALLEPARPDDAPEALWRPESVERFAALLRAEPGALPAWLHEAFWRLRGGR